MVLARARALLTSTPEGATAYLDADLREPDKILAGAADLLEFRQPAAVLLIGILQLIPDADDPHAIVARLIQAVLPGSWLAVYRDDDAAYLGPDRPVLRRPATTGTWLGAGTPVTARLGRA
jgi:hypothetical protein